MGLRFGLSDFANMKNTITYCYDPKQSKVVATSIGLVTLDKVSVLAQIAKVHEVIIEALINDPKIDFESVELNLPNDLQVVLRVEVEE